MLLTVPLVGPLQSGIEVTKSIDHHSVDLDKEKECHSQEKIESILPTRLSKDALLRKAWDNSTLTR